MKPLEAPQKLNFQDENLTQRLEQKLMSFALF